MGQGTAAMQPRARGWAMRGFIESRALHSAQGALPRRDHGRFFSRTPQDMPIYAYKCSACGFAKDVLQKVSDAPLSACPSCGQAHFAKQVTAAGFQLKGSGWYVTDFRGGGDSNKSSAPAPGPAPGAAPAPSPAPAPAPGTSS